jgi:hypothetical protein
MHPGPARCGDADVQAACSYDHGLETMEVDQAKLDGFRHSGDGGISASRVFKPNISASHLCPELRIALQHDWAAACLVGIPTPTHSTSDRPWPSGYAIRAVFAAKLRAARAVETASI